MSRKRNNFYAVWLSDNEMSVFKSKISNTNLNQSTYIRKCILEKNITVIPGIRDLIIELERIGNNLNQIARAVNEGSLKVINDDLKDIEYDLKAVWVKLNEALKKI